MSPVILLYSRILQMQGKFYLVTKSRGSTFLPFSLQRQETRARGRALLQIPFG